MGRERRISLYYVASPIRLLKPRDVSNHCPDRYCGPGGRHHDLVCAAGARADRQYLFRSSAAAAGRHPPRQSATARAATSRRRRRSAGTAARPAVADPEPAAAGAGRGAARKLPVAAAGAAARNTVAPQGTQPGIAVQPPQPGQPGSPTRRRRAMRCRDSAGPASAQGRAANAGHLAAGRRGRVRAAGHQDHQQEGELLRPRQDHRPHHQFRRGYRRDRAVRRAAGENQRLLYAAVHRGRQHRCLRRGRRDHAAGRGEADLLRLDVCRKPRPAWRRAPRLRHLADRLQRPRPDHRQRAARTAKGAPAARAEASAAAEAGRAASAGDAAAAAIPAAHLSRHRRRSNGPADCLVGCSGTRRAPR